MRATLQPTSALRLGRASQPGVFARASPQEGDAGVVNDNNDAEKRPLRADKAAQLAEASAQFMDAAAQLTDAWAALLKDPGNQVLRNKVDALSGRLPEALKAVKLSGGSMELADVLCNLELPTVVYRTRALLSVGTTSKYARQPQQLLPWENFKADADEWGRQQAQNLAGLSASLNPAEMLNAWDESGIYPLYDNYLARVLGALWSSGRLGEQCQLVKASAVVGNPDRGIVLQRGNYEKLLIPIKIKHIFTLPTDIPPLYQVVLVDERKPALQKHIEQLFGYVVGNDTTYGILASDAEYYFCRVDGGNMYISDAVKHDALGPSVINCICYLTHLAQQLQPGQAGVTGSSPDDSRPDGSLGSSGLLGTRGGSLGAAERAAHEGAAGPAGPAAHEGGGDGSLPSRLSWSAAAGLMQPSVISAAAWRLGVTLGSGITGIVSSGLSPLGLPVAIKVPSPEGRHKQGREAQVRQLQNEVDVLQALLQLQGIFVPRLVAYGTFISRANDPFPCVVTELLQGAVPLNKATAEQLPATLEEDAMALLAALHAHGVAHCDIHGGHLLLMPDGTLRLIDFGHASLNASPEDMARDAEDLRCLLAGLPEPRLSPTPHLVGLGACK